MTFAKEQLIREIETLPDAKIEQVAVFVNALKATEPVNGSGAEALTLEDQFAAEDRLIAASALADPCFHLSLDEMMELVTAENRHTEIQTGPPVGNEVW